MGISKPNPRSRRSQHRNDSEKAAVGVNFTGVGYALPVTLGNRGVGIEHPRDIFGGNDALPPRPFEMA